MLDNTVLILLALLGALVWFWLSTLRVRELALDAARDVCRRQDLQLLDATVALQRLTLRRSAGQVRLERTFRFSYSDDGVARSSGFVITIGNRVEQVGL
ncbi:MAG: DUF3301 domain-containing protein [Gammaproteobacteria bacterium]